MVGDAKKPSSILSKPKFSSSKLKPKSIIPSYLDETDLPSSDDDEEEEEETRQPIRKENRATKPNFSTIGTPSDKDLKKPQKRDKNKISTDAAIVSDKQEEALKEEDRDTFNVVIGSNQTSNKDSSIANVRDVVVKKFSVSASGKELFKNADLCISHRRRYGLLGPNGTGKSTLLKLLAWGKLPVPSNMDMLLVEQEMGEELINPLQVVIAAHEELEKLRTKAESLSKNDNDDQGDLAEVYEKLELLDSDAVEAKASKILAGLGFTKENLAKPTKLKWGLENACFTGPCSFRATHFAIVG